MLCGLMKVTPNNQTLILAGERGYGIPSRGALVSSLPDGSSGSVLKTVTIMTALPDTTLVYLRADYSPPGDYSPPADAPSSRSIATAPKPALTYARSDSAANRAPGAPRDAYGNPRAQSRHVELYAQTQLLLTSTAETAHIDVRA
jgi:hypothetical protein